MNAKFAINGKQIETERLLLRPFSLSDLDDFFEYASQPGVGEMAGWLHHQNKQKSLQILQGFVQDDQTFAICLKQNNKVIGSLGVDKYGLEDKLSEFFSYKGREIGFVLAKDYWGQGLMTEAVAAVVNYLFLELNLDFLTCGYYTFNTRSKRVQEKCGFKPYRKLISDTRMGTKEETILNLLVHPNKQIVLEFSHPETLIHQD